MIILGIIMSFFPLISIGVFRTDNIPIETKHSLDYNSRSTSWKRTITASDGDKVVAKIELGIPPIGTTYPCISLFHISELKNEGHIFFLEKSVEWYDERPMVENACLVLRGVIIVTAHKRFMGIPYTVFDTRGGINVQLYLSKNESGWRLVEVSDFSTSGYYIGPGGLKMELSDN